MIELNENTKTDLINKLTKLSFNYKIRTLLISLISFIFYLIVFAYILKTQDVGYIIPVIFFTLLTILIVMDYYSINWNLNSKKMIIETLSQTDKLNKNIKIKYKPTTSLLENQNIPIPFDLLIFINYLMLANSDNLGLANYYLNKGFTKKFNFNAEDELIIESEDNLEIQIIEVFLKEKYTKTEGSGKNKRTITHEITNFEGISISTKLKDIPILKNPIIIYTSNLFKNPLNTNPIETQEKKYKSVNLLKDIYCLYNINDENIFKNLENILIKISDKFYNQKKYYKSLIIYYNNSLYLFINHEDDVFKTKNILESPFYLFANTNTIEKTIMNFKNQLEKILELAL